jgi:NAD(P)-dependent dehydrogenase (short-subunit alcohol dehydrogenase family)
MQDRFNLTGKVVVVTGGTGLLGSAYCQALADHGAQVVMADLAAADPMGKAKLVQTPTGVVAHGVNCDVGQEAQVVQLFADVMATFGRVDAVLNNAAATDNVREVSGEGNYGDNGDADNAAFTIDGSALNTVASIDFETKNAYTVRVRSTDANGLSTEKTFSIAVSNASLSAGLGHAASFSGCASWAYAPHTTNRHTHSNICSDLMRRAVSLGRFVRER